MDREPAQFCPKMEPLAGSIQIEFRRCGKAGCRCARGFLHGPYFRLVQRVGDRTTRRYVPLHAVADVARACALHRSQFPSRRRLARWWLSVRAAADGAWTGDERTRD